MSVDAARRICTSIPPRFSEQFPSRRRRRKKERKGLGGWGGEDLFYTLTAISSILPLCSSLIEIYACVVSERNLISNLHVQFAQELLSTFGTDLGEVSLVPVTGGFFSVTIWHAGQTQSAGQGEVSTQEVLLWDRKRDGGFPGMLMKSFLFLFC